jgi:hypothetical protein
MNDPLDVLMENAFEFEGTETHAATGDTVYYLVAENGRKFVVIMNEVTE